MLPRPRWGRFVPTELIDRSKYVCVSNNLCFVFLDRALLSVLICIKQITVSMIFTASTKDLEREVRYLPKNKTCAPYLFICDQGINLAFDSVYIISNSQSKPFVLSKYALALTARSWCDLTPQSTGTTYGSYRSKSLSIFTRGTRDRIMLKRSYRPFTQFVVMDSLDEFESGPIKCLPFRLNFCEYSRWCVCACVWRGIVCIKFCFGVHVCRVRMLLVFA